MRKKTDWVLLATWLEARLVLVELIVIGAALAVAGTWILVKGGLP